MTLTIWQIENYDEETKNIVKAFAARKNVSIAEGLKIIVAEWEAAKK